MEEEMYCERCQVEIKTDSDFCWNCGALFNDTNCTNHDSSEAEGVCVICENPFCAECGSDSDNIFLCFDHEEYEIIQGMARVYGTSDVLQAEYCRECLDQSGLHPFIFSKKASPLHLGGSDYSLFTAAGEPPGNPINEIKIMLPFNEVLKGIKVLSELEITDE